MLLAAVYALTDSVNALLIGVLVAVGVMLPRGVYRKVAALLIAGDFLGVFGLAVIVMAVATGLKEHVEKLVHSPLFGLAFVLLGLVAAFMAWRKKPDAPTSPLMDAILKPLRTPTPLTFLTGLILGLVQSATSAPFFGGIIILAAGDHSALVRYGGMIVYAALALSLPTTVALAVGQVRRRPHSTMGRAFNWARSNPHQCSVVGGYVVAIVLIALGLVHL